MPNDIKLDAILFMPLIDDKQKANGRLFLSKQLDAKHNKWNDAKVNNIKSFEN